jgi:antibiotic biosynthesis monooxygenase (ABM) superfamily enzyme
MTRRESLALVALIWAGVFPSVLLITYAFEWFDIDAPTWVRVMVSTLFTVPFIEFVILPRVERLIAAARDDSRAELLAAQARDAGEDTTPE